MSISPLTYAHPGWPADMWITFRAFNAPEDSQRVVDAAINSPYLGRPAVTHGMFSTLFMEAQNLGPPSRHMLERFPYLWEPLYEFFAWHYDLSFIAAIVSKAEKPETYLNRSRFDALEI